MYPSCEKLFAFSRTKWASSLCHTDLSSTDCVVQQNVETAAGNEASSTMLRSKEAKGVEKAPASSPPPPLPEKSSSTSSATPSPATPSTPVTTNAPTSAMAITGAQAAARRVSSQTRIPVPISPATPLVTRESPPRRHLPSVTAASPVTPSPTTATSSIAAQPPPPPPPLPPLPPLASAAAAAVPPVRRDDLQSACSVQMQLQLQCLKPSVGLVSSLLFTRLISRVERFVYSPAFFLDDESVELRLTH